MSKAKIMRAVVWIVVLGVIGGGVWYGASRMGFLSSSGGWQAVFLTNNQVYFGKLSRSLGDQYVLRDVFYLRVSESLQPATGQPELNLVKLGGELHGPQDAMYIPKGSVLFWEDLKGDSQVVQSITKFLGQ